MRTYWSWRSRTSCARRHDSSSFRLQSFTGFGHQDVAVGGGERVVIADDGDQLGIALDGLDQGPARAEQQTEAPGGLGGFPEGGDQERALVCVDHEVAQSEEPEVGVR